MAGPAASLVMAGICGAAAFVLGAAGAVRLAVLAVTAAVWLNVILDVFSGLPGVGPDGGRIVRVLTWARTGDPARSGIDGEGAAVPPDRRDTMRLSEVATPLAQVVRTGPDELLPHLLARLRIRLHSRVLHSRVLLLGVALALLLRGIFIALGASALHRFGWLLYLFGAFLLYTSVRLAVSSRPGRRSGEEEVPRMIRRFMPRAASVEAGAASVDAGAARARPAGIRRAVTPLVALVAAIALADLAFALDSIPAIFGLTREPYLVFTANMFALLGLRHLYFLIGGLLGQLAHLAAGLAAILGFIGVKLVTTALRESGVSQLGPVPVPHISTGLSLAVIAGVIAAVVVTSLLVRGRRTQPEIPAPVAGPHRGGQS